MVDDRLLGSEGLDRRSNSQGESLGTGQSLFRAFQLTLPRLEPSERLLCGLELILGRLQHRPGLFDSPRSRSDGLDILDSTLGQVEHVLDLSFDRLDACLAGQRLVQSF